MNNTFLAVEKTETFRPSQEGRNHINLKAHYVRLTQDLNMETKSSAPVPVPMSMPPRGISTQLRFYRLASFVTFGCSATGFFLTLRRQTKN